ncbi:MAG: transposase, partial [Acidobacteriales bacterium]|nr:transposase [Terriglobales bacterium]
MQELRNVRQLREETAQLKQLVLDLARAQATTIRLRLLKIGAQIRITVRKVWLSLASGYPLQRLFGQVWAALR